MEHVPPLCHSCHILKPLRSKHCRVKRKCVLVFDHYCPFVGNCVGLYNYKYFLLYLVFHTLSELGLIATCIKYMARDGFDWYMCFSMVYLGLFIVPVLMMLSYHFKLISNNLTTNEHSNLFRYQYLQNSEGGYHNPFDLGMMHNLYTRMFPSEESYKPSARGRRSSCHDSGCRDCDPRSSSSTGGEIMMTSLSGSVANDGDAERAREEDKLLTNVV